MQGREEEVVVLVPHEVRIGALHDTADAVAPVLSPRKSHSLAHSTRVYPLPIYGLLTILPNCHVHPLPKDLGTLSLCFYFDGCTHCRVDSHLLRVEVAVVGAQGLARGEDERDRLWGG